MRIVKQYWREALLILLCACAASILYYWTVDRPEDTFIQALMLIGLALCIAGAVWLIRSLWRDKWKQAAARGMQKVFARIQRFFERFAEHLGIRRSNKSVLGGKTTVIFDRVTIRESESLQRSAKPPKWKQLDSEKARMRYLYRQMLTGKLKRGSLIYASDTPSEVEKRLKDRTPTEGELFEMYVDLRYDDRRDPDGEAVKRLKKELEIK